MRIIARKLDPTQRQQVINWAENQLQRIYFRYQVVPSEKLCGGKYLLTELPELEGSSLINSSSLVK